MILVAGCGYLGARIAALLHDAGTQVTGLTHSPESAHHLAEGVPWRVEPCDISDAAAVTSLAQNLGATYVRCVVHCASSGRGGAGEYRRVYVDGVRNLSAAFQNARIVFTSSTSVYSQTDGSVVTETDAALPEKETGRLLVEAEDAALRTGGVVARLAGIYGPGRWFVLRNLLEGKAAIEGGEGEGRVLNQIHREDAASAIVHLVSKKTGGVFNVVDDMPMTQRACLEKLAARFGMPVPPAVPPNPERKRGWTSKRVTNTKLRATGWQPRFASCFDALDGDGELVSSILAQIAAESPDVLPRRRNVVLIGLMGSGKSTVGRMVAAKLGFDFVDTDQIVTQTARCSIPQIFEREGEAAFRSRESAALRSLLHREHCVVATGGGIVTQPRNNPVLRHLGYIVWLDAGVATLHRRTAGGHDRPLLKADDPKAKLQRLLEERGPLYTRLADLRITTDDLSQDETAYGVAESVRLHFGSQL